MASLRVVALACLLAALQVRVGSRAAAPERPSAGPWRKGHFAARAVPLPVGRCTPRLTTPCARSP